MIDNRYLKMFVGIVLLSGTVSAGEWPHWRGPFMNGSSEEVNLPSTWSKTQNVAWVKELPGTGSATPVVSGGRVFISSTWFPACSIAVVESAVAILIGSHRS